MDDHTFLSRIASLAQKCRKAVRLYTSMGRMQGGEQLASSEKQIGIWRDTNACLLEELLELLQRQDRRSIVLDVFTLRDKYYTLWRTAEADLHQKQKALIAAAQNGDFNKCCLLSRQLVDVKAETQAKQAVHFELQTLLEKIKSNPPAEYQEQLGIPLESDDDSNSPLLQQAKVIPLRRNHR